MKSGGVQSQLLVLDFKFSVYIVIAIVKQLIYFFKIIIIINLHLKIILTKATFLIIIINTIITGSTIIIISIGTSLADGA